MFVAMLVVGGTASAKDPSDTSMVTKRSDNVMINSQLLVPGAQSRPRGHVS